MSGYYQSDIPQDLSAKFKTVGVQTEHSSSSSSLSPSPSSCVEAVQEILTGLSEKQTRMLLGVITSVLFKTEQKSNQYDTPVTGLHKQGETSGWTSLEPETPPISPPHHHLLHVPVRQIHDSCLLRKFEEPRHLGLAANTIKSEEVPLYHHSLRGSRTSSEEEALEGSSGLSRDQKLVMEMNIPFTVEDIINKPMEEFNDILSKNGVSEEIINVCRDIRRRGKNKIAAQNCRKRKVDQIFNLEEDIALVRNRKKVILSERAELLRQKQEVRTSLELLERKVFTAVGKSGDRWILTVDEKSGKIVFCEDSTR